MNTTFNVNEYVWVKLTDYGRECHRKDHDDFVANIRRLTGDDPKMPYSPPDEDSEGWSRWQGHELMRQFGPHMGIGFGPVPFETTIRLDSKDLKPTVALEGVEG